MGGRVCFGVLAGLLLISVAGGVRDGEAVGRLRLLMAEKEGEGSKSGKDAGSQSSPALPVEGSGSSSSTVTKNSPPLGNPPNSPLPSHAPPNPPAAPQKASPSTPVVESSLNPASTLVGSAHPQPAPGGPVNPLPSSSGNPVNRSPPPGNPSHSSPASDGRLSPPPPSGDHPLPAEAKLPNPAPNENGKGTPMNEKDDKEKGKKKPSGSSSGPDASKEKGQENAECKATMRTCHTKGLVACLQQPQNESKRWSLLVQNEGKDSLNLDISAPSSVKFEEIVKTLVLPQNKRSKIGFDVDAAEGVRIVLNAGNGDCILDMPATSTFAANFLQRIPNYANHVTPIYGVYLVSLTVIFAGGTWACCKFRKRRRRVDAGVAYQQLEMGAQQLSTAPLDEDVANGWDDSWNDDWDEEAAPRPPEKRESASGNGVTFRSSDKNEWEDWDD